MELADVWLEMLSKLTKCKQGTVSHQLKKMKNIITTHLHVV